MPGTHFHRVIILWGSLLILSSAVSAISPVPVSNMAYITIDENILLVQGGVDPSDKNPASANTTSKQFFSLDLSTSDSWNTASPPWTQLNLDGDSGPASYGHSLSMSPNHRNITVWDQGNASSRGIWSYSLESQKWTKVADWPKELSTQGGLQAVAHPTSGQVYIPSGSNINDSGMLIYDPVRLMVKLAPNPPKDDDNPLKWYGYSFVWSEVRKSFLIIGGGGDVGPYFFEYALDDNNWRELPLSGDVPPRVKGACMVPAYNGTKMLLFGGLTSADAAIGSLYTLNVNNMTWSLSQATQPNQNRSGMACSVSGDNFIIWGGKSASGAVMTGAPLIYNINTSNWTQLFERGTHFIPTPGSSNSENTDGSGNNHPMTSPADVGGAITAGVVVVAVVGFIFHRRRKNRRLKATMEGQSHQYYRMQGSDLSLNSIVSPPPITGALSQDGSRISGSVDDVRLLQSSNAHSGRSRLYGSHSNAQPISFPQQNGRNSVTDMNYNIIDLNSRPLPAPPAFSSPYPPTNLSWQDPRSSTSYSIPSESELWATPPTNPSWPSASVNPTWPTPPTPTCPPMPVHESLAPSSSSPTSSWTPLLAQSNQPSAPPPPYQVSSSSSPTLAFREEAVTGHDLMPSQPPINPAFENVGSSSSSYINGGYDQKVEELQHQLAAHKEELSRRSIGLHPQFYLDTTAGSQNKSKVIPRSPQGNGDITISSGSSSGRSSQSNEELQQQVLALQAELSRLQAMIGS